MTRVIGYIRVSTAEQAVGEGRIPKDLPFRFTLSVPVEIMTRSLDASEIAARLGGQAAWAAITLTIAISLWNAGVRRFESVGG